MPDTEHSQQLALMQQLVEMSRERSQMSAQRSYMNAERTLSVWIRTALALMVLGIAIDRLGLFLRRMPGSPQQAQAGWSALSAWGGGALVALGVAMVICFGLRFLAYSVAYRRNYAVPPWHGPSLASVFTLLVALFGIAVLVVMLVFSGHA